MSVTLLDPLYGSQYLPVKAWHVALTPEVQRLREVRMCNINSLALLGAATVSRFEHSIGTAILAQECVNCWPSSIDPVESQNLVLAGLLHDVGTAGFGHSVEYMLKDDGFAHEDLRAISLPDNQDIFTYRDLDFEPYYFGRRRALLQVLGESNLTAISQTIQGKGKLGPLINGSIDLDNVDNVYRLAYHMGLTREVNIPLSISRGMSTNERGIVLRSNLIEAVVDWYETRRNLYHHLLLNEEDFAAKCMLEVALRGARRIGPREVDWNNVDYATMVSLHGIPGEVGAIASRIMTGDLFGCLGIFQMSYDSASALTGGEESLAAALEGELAARTVYHSIQLAVHFIWDIRKTERRLQFDLEDGQTKSIGRDSSRILVGVFSKNRDLSHLRLSQSRGEKEGLADITLRMLRKILGVGVDLAPREQWVELNVHRT